MSNLERFLNNTNIINYLELIIFISYNNKIVSKANPIKSKLSTTSVSINSSRFSKAPEDSKYPSLKYVNYPKKYAASTLNSL